MPTSTDLLTGLPTFHALLDRLAALATDMPLTTAVMFDIDGLIWVNDQFGHSIGDGIIQDIAHWLAARIPNGYCLRLGGDEFLMLLPEVTPDAAVILAQAALAAVMQRQIPYVRRDHPRHFLALNAVVMTLPTGAAPDIPRLRERCAAAIYSAKTSQGKEHSVVGRLIE